MRQSNQTCRRIIRTVLVYWHVYVHDLAVGAKNVAQMVLVDVLGEFLDDDLGMISS
jgi:hypothetical protein